MLPGRYNIFSHGMTSVKQQKLGWTLPDRAAVHSTLQTKSFASLPLLLHVVMKNSQDKRQGSDMNSLFRTLQDSQSKAGKGLRLPHPQRAALGLQHAGFLQQ